MAERTLSASRFGVGSLRARLRLLALGTLPGLVAGTGTFMYIKFQYIPWNVPRLFTLLLVALGGAYAHFLADDLAESITLSLIGFFAGFAVHVVAWIAPLWIIPYPPVLRDLLLPQMLGRALTGGILAYIMTFYGAYFAAVMVGGYMEG